MPAIRPLGVVAVMATLGTGLVPSSQGAATVLRGTVMTSDGRPVRRAHVVASGPITIRTDTDTDGMFRLEGLTRGTYTITPAKMGFVESGPSTVSVVQGAGQLDVVVLMTPAAVITGRLLDRDGSAVVDAAVMLLRKDVVVSRLMTDDRGVFRFHTLRAGTYDVWAATESRSEAQTVSVISGQTIDVQLVTSSTANGSNPAISTLPDPLDEAERAPIHAIRGRVTSAETGSPLSGVTVQLRGEGLQQTTSTAESGRFLFRDVSDGRYSITATGTDKYIGLTYGQRTPQDPPALVVMANGHQTAADASIALPEKKVLAGRLVDEFGDPAPDLTVVMVQNLVVAGKRRLLPVSGGTSIPTASSDDAGEFRLRDVPPGTFFLMALSGPFATASVMGGPAGPQGHGLGFALTFFPGTAQPAEAQPVTVEVRGIPPPVTFGLAPTELGDVTGRVVDRTGTPVGGANVMLLQLQGGDIRMVVPARATAGADGFFSIKNVPIGSYVAQAFGSGFASGTVGVSPHTTSTVELTVAPPAAVRGKLILDGTSDPSLLNKIRISAFPTDFVRSPLGRIQPTTVIHDDGTFEVSGLLGVNTLVFEIPLPWTLTGITSAGSEITDQPIDSSSGDVSDLRVLFAPTASTLVCKVSDTVGHQQLTGFVLVFPQDAARWTFPSRYVRGLTAGANGDFTTTALPPGLYRAVPFDAIPRSDWMNPDFLETLRARGQSFVVGPGESVTVVLKQPK